MAQSAPLILRLLASSVTAATRAGKIIKDVMTKGELGIVEKGLEKNDVQTEADRSAQRCIVASLSKQFPDVTIIGEEGQLSESDVPSDWIVTESDQSVLSANCPPSFVNTVPEDIVVWVDPLDGTSEYTEGLLDHVTVLIGVAVSGRAVGGVIHQPYYNYKTVPDTPGRTLWGLVGAGVGGFNPIDPPQDKFIITTSRSHRDGMVSNALKSLNPDDVISVGGAGHKVLVVLEGRAHAYVYASRGCKKWDTCAPEAILEASGGRLTDIHGKHYSYDKNVSFPDNQGIFATARTVDHDALVSKLPQEIKDAFPY
ncbi:3'(2'),5'-bisphosphate nucleotidase 1 [Leptinotarsa decemlineata]|uniref:3'(2'),5'-bisphosphate nucleotidase 1 n=1 Tax=Leptinotarsa decemlineata TaxID=7539 RepID=UPI000C253A8C|nr:3'(2'),5'-bisphosphate nucleotidase 1-like [Leptinotarsa decemlineata]